MNTFPKTFDGFLDEVRTREPVEQFEGNFKKTLNLAAQDPRDLYRFFARYNYLNAQIASTIASLVGNVGKSRKTFLDPKIPVVSEADYAFEVAHLIGEASHDEYGDPKHKDINTGEGISHRLLATGLLKSIGDYAGLSHEERNAVMTPEWQKSLMEKVQTTYSGEKEDLTKLGEAMGAHIFSEWSADNVEFSNAAIALFIEGKDQGYHAYLKNNPTVTVQGKTFLAHSWLKTHGGYDENLNQIVHGVEFEHLKTGYEAVKLVMEKLPDYQKEIFQEAVFNGVSKCRKMLNAFFVVTELECKREGAPSMGPEI